MIFCYGKHLDLASVGPSNEMILKWCTRLTKTSVSDKATMIFLKSAWTAWLTWYIIRSSASSCVHFKLCTTVVVESSTRKHDVTSSCIAHLKTLASVLCVYFSPSQCWSCILLLEDPQNPLISIGRVCSTDVIIVSVTCCWPRRSRSCSQEKSSKSLGRKSAFFGLEKSRIRVELLYRNVAQ